MTHKEALRLLSEAELHTPITELLASAGLTHFPLDGIARDVRYISSGESLGHFSASGAVVLYVQHRDNVAKAA